MGFGSSEHRGREVEKGSKDVGEVGLGLGPTKCYGDNVVGPNGFIGGVKGAKPLSGLFPRVTNLGGEAALGTLADTPKMGLSTLTFSHLSFNFHHMSYIDFDRESEGEVGALDGVTVRESEGDKGLGFG